MLKKQWTFKEEVDENLVKYLADSLNVSVVLAKLLILRNVNTFQEARKFFRPSLEELYDPFLMDGMKEASSRVISAITNNQKIAIYGDYDVDGTCSTALMYLFLKELGADVAFFVPNRLTDGYGLSKNGIDYIKSLGTKLLITVDCGITAIDEVDYANKFGIDTIICDHHQPSDSIPNAYAVLDPLKPGCNYPFKYLSGAGVAFKLARAVSSRIGNIELPLQYLDLVAIAGAADIVPLEDENRILVKHGLEAINNGPRPGIAALIKSARMEFGNLSAGQIVFTIAPRINAVGRLGDADRAIELFLTNDEKDAERLAAVLEEENAERRKIDEATFSHAVSLAEQTIDFDNEFVTVLHYDEWHPGVIGIVASRLVENYYRPTIMLTTIDGVAKGSARSIAGFNIYEALKACSDLLIQFGGHEAAAGLAIKIINIPELRRRLNIIIKESFQKNLITPVINIDTTINFSEITPKFFRILEQFAPFGPANPRPVFKSDNSIVLL